MHGVVSLLEDKYYRQVEDLWAELEKEFGVRGVYVTPYPHFSYQVASYYDTEVLEPILRDFASKSSPFQIHAGGLGIFTGASPVLYIPIVRTQELNRFHAALWQEISQAGARIVDYYHPEYWVPHITIGFGDMNKDNLAQIVRLLSDRDFNWKITVDNLALIYDTGSKQELKSRFDLKKPSLHK
jgi:2'-5' RNA ligase superfamily